MDKDQSLSKIHSSTDHTGEAESPFLDQELFAKRSEEELESRAAALVAESPFQGAFVEEPGILAEPELKEADKLGEDPLAEEEFTFHDRLPVEPDEKEAEEPAEPPLYSGAEPEEGLYTDEDLAEIEAFAEEQQDPNQPATEEQLEEFIEKCYDIVSSTAGKPPAIGFEFDLNYGASTVRPPLAPDDPGFSDSVYVLEGKNITSHRINANGFRLEGDGNRIEIGTKAFDLTDTGKSDLEKVMKEVLDLVSKIEKQSCTTTPDASLGYPSETGAPRHFAPTFLEGGVACIHSLGFCRKKSARCPHPSYFGRGCAVSASPQATFTLPLAKVLELVNRIEKSEKLMVPGLAMSGPSGFRQGTRSRALYEARDAVKKSRDDHIKAGTQLSSGDAVIEANYSPTLMGLLILMVSYLRTSELTYSAAAGDTEEFAKAYLPLNVKNPFRLLYAELTEVEKRVFKELYDNPRTNLWRLAKPSATHEDGKNQLFPAFVKGHQECWFNSAPTWDDFVERTVTNRPLKRIKFCPGKEKKGEDIGCEVLFAPLSRIIPYEVGSRRVTVEMRRLGFNWVLAKKNKKKGIPGWMTMTTRLFDMAVELNK